MLTSKLHPHRPSLLLHSIPHRERTSPSLDSMEAAWRSGGDRGGRSDRTNFGVGEKRRRPSPPRGGRLVMWRSRLRQEEAARRPDPVRERRGGTWWARGEDREFVELVDFAQDSEGLNDVVYFVADSDEDSSGRKIVSDNEDGEFVPDSLVDGGGFSDVLADSLDDVDRFTVVNPDSMDVLLEAVLHGDGGPEDAEVVLHGDGRPEDAVAVLHGDGSPEDAVVVLHGDGGALDEADSPGDTILHGDGDPHHAVAHLQGRGAPDDATGGPSDAIVHGDTGPANAEFIGPDIGGHGQPLSSDNDSDATDTDVTQDWLTTILISLVPSYTHCL
uniref:Uncharacterized protein n=1 Tax=Arundo donax TaxID=35708 RepID=A0A0A9EJY1_ARUDO